MRSLRTVVPVFLLLFLFACSTSFWQQPIPTVGSMPANEWASHAYYVATDGDDANPGTQTQPWRTIQHAADVLRPGDTVYVRAGIYYEDVEIRVSGSASGGYITFRNYPGETPVVDGSGLTVPAPHAGLFFIENKQYLIIQGFELAHYRSSTRDIVPIGIHVRGNSHHIQIVGNVLHDIASTAPVDNEGLGRDAHGIAVYGDQAPDGAHDIRIEENELYNLTLGSSEALVINGNVSKFLVRGNRIRHVDNIGIDVIGFEGVAPDPDVDQPREGYILGNEVSFINSMDNPVYGGEPSAGGIYIDGGTQVIVARNRVHENNIGIEIASEHPFRATSFITVTNNVIYWNDIGGIFLGGYDRKRGRTEDCLIVNNTLFENDALREGNGEILFQYDTRRNQVLNNIVYANDQGYLVMNPYSANIDNRIDYNLYFSPLGQESSWQWKGVFYRGWNAWQRTGLDSHGRFADPQFVDLSQPELALLGISPAIDVGEPDFAPADDVLGTSRPQGRGIDLGAYEYVNPNVFLPSVLYHDWNQ